MMKNTNKNYGLVILVGDNTNKGVRSGTTGRGNKIF